MKPLLKKRLLTAAKCVIFALVAWGIWRTVEGARADFREKAFSLRQVDLRWLLVAGGFYLAGLLPMSWYWFRLLRALGQQPGVLRTLGAYYIGHLGKYVPGKAMVVVLRTGLIRSLHVDTTVAAASVFIETLTMMAVGATLAALLIGLFVAEQTNLLLLAVALAVAAGVPTLPPIFRRLVRIAGVVRANPAIEQHLGGLNARLMATGWVANLLGWSLLGLSLWATVQSLPAELLPAGAQQAGNIPLLMAAVALAMVAGFLSLIPGGLGVREFVLSQLLEPAYGPTAPIVAAVLLRLVWLVAELALSTILYGCLRRETSSPLPPPD